MGTPEASETTHPETLGVFDAVDSPGLPLTTSEVAEELDCARRTAYGKLEDLADRGEIETKKVGARGRIWWRSPDRSTAIQSSTESALEQAQFQELVETVSDYAIFVLDRDGHVQTWNEGARQIKGYDEDEIVGGHFSTFYTEADRDAGVPARNLEKAAAEGRTEDEGWRVRADGSRFWANVMISALHDDDGDLQGFVKITRDMTERHEYEERLRTEKERFETLVREVKDYAIFLLDSDGVVQTWNEGASQLKGYDEDEIVGEHFSLFYTEADREADRPERNLATAVEEGRVEDEGERVRDDGTTFWANVTITALYDDEGDVDGFAKVTRDVTERHEYEERLRDQNEELDELDQINAVIRDIDQTLVTATEREEIEREVCERLAASETYSGAWIAEYADGYEEITPRTWAGISESYLDEIRETAPGDETEKGVGATALQTRTIQPVQELGRDPASEPWREAALTEGFESAITVPLLYNGVEYGVLTVYADDESAFDQRKIAVMGELGETISHAIASIRRKERERTLTALQESTRELLHTDSREGIGDIIVGTLTDDLALADAAVYCFDTDENAIKPVSSSFQTDSRTARLTAGADSPIWTSFIEDETRFSESALPTRGVDGRRTMVVPLGDHGVLAVAVPAQEPFDEQTRNLVELVAATTEAAFDRVDSEANLRERDELLQEQNQRLQQVNRINTIIREVDQGLVQARTREEIQRVVCDHLTKSDRFRFAWIGTSDEVNETLTPEAWSGSGRGYLDSIDAALERDPDDAEPAVTAARTGDITAISNVAENLRGGRWRKEAFSREFQSAVGVPLRYGDVDYGVLTVYADRPAVFDEMMQSVFGELGETIANAMNGVETKETLFSDQVVELEFELEATAASFLARLATAVDCEVAFEGVIPLSEAEARTFFVVTGASPEGIRDELDRSVVVESSEVLASDDGHLVEAVISGRTIALSLVEFGASLRRLTVTEDGIQLTADLPAKSDTRRFIERFQDRYETAEFVARRERDRPIQTRSGLYAELEAELTDRQLEVLKTAYYSGYFRSPRRSTGGDVADLLNVSQPTVTEQLRAAQCTVLDLLFSDDVIGTQS